MKDDKGIAQRLEIVGCPRWDGPQVALPQIVHLTTQIESPAPLEHVANHVVLVVPPFVGMLPGLGEEAENARLVPSTGG